MSGFQPLFPSLGRPDSTEPAAPAESPKPSSSPAGFTSLFGGPPPSEDTPAFTPLLKALGKPVPAPEPPPEPVDLDVVLERAKAEGRDEAKAEAEERLAEMQATVDALGPAMDELAKLRKEALKQAASDVATLVVQISRKLLGQSLAVHPEALNSVVRDAIDRVPDEGDLRIRVHPDDVSRVRDAVADRYEEGVEGDPSIEAGCRVEAHHATVDATLDAAMEGIEAAVAQWVEQQG